MDRCVIWALFVAWAVGRIWFLVVLAGACFVCAGAVVFCTCLAAVYAPGDRGDESSD